MTLAISHLVGFEKRWDPPLDSSAALVPLPGHRARSVAEDVFEVGLERMESWNPKQPFINGCFNWMIPNHCIKDGCFTKHPFINGCLGFQDPIVVCMVVSFWGL